MGIFDNIARSRGYQKPSVPVEKAGELSTGDSWAEIFGGSTGTSFTSFNSQREQLQAYVDWVYAATRYIAESCSTIDLRVFVNHTQQKNATLGQKLIHNPKSVQELRTKKKLMVIKENGKLVTKEVAPLEELESSPVLDLLDSPNPYMTRIEFFEMTFLHLELAGEAFWAINRENNKPNGTPTELWPLMPNLVSVVADKEKFVIGYMYTVNGEQLPFAPEDIIHHKYSNPNDLRRGMSTVQAAARIIDTDSHMADYNRRIFYNGATVDAVLYTDNKLTDVNWRRLQSQWKDNYSGSANSHKTAILENGLKYQPMALSNKDLDFLKGMEFNRDMILALFGVPKSLLGMDASMSRANAETAEYVFAKHKARPKMLRLTTRITEDLAVQFDDRLVISFTDPVPDDKEFLLKEKQASVGSANTIGWRTVNDIRAEDGDDPVEGGDEIFINGNMIPMARAAQEPEPEDKPAVIEEDPDAPDNDDSAEDTGDQDNEDGGDSSESTDTGQNSTAGDSGSTTSDSSTGDKSVKDLSEEDTGKDLMPDPLDIEPPPKETKKKDKKPVVHGTDSQVGKANSRLHRSEEQLKDARSDYDAVRDAIVARYEEKFLKTSHTRFEQQRKEVLANLVKQYDGKKSLKPRTKGLKDFLKNMFNAEKSKTAWLSSLIPIYKSAIAAQGQASLDYVTGGSNSDGTSETFSTAAASIANYYESRSTLISVGIDAETQKLLASTLTEGINNDENLAELSDRVESVYGAAAGYRAQRIARTESIASTTRATIEGWEQSGVVEGKKWLAQGPNMCPYCASMDGKVIRLGSNYFDKGDKYSVEGVGTLALNYEDVTGPPVHVNCACTLEAILSGTYDFENDKPLSTSDESSTEPSAE